MRFTGWKRKAIVLTVLAFLVGSGIVPSTVGIIQNKNGESTLKTGGFIQGLIDNATDGDTIYIPSGIYYENIIINKSISLIGEDKETTIIDGNWSGDVVSIISDGVTISGFTIQNSGEKTYLGFDSGIEVRSNHNIITRNIISKNAAGIYLVRCSDSNISGNNISVNVFGVLLSRTKGNRIFKNNFLHNNVDGFARNVFLYRWCWRQNYWSEPRILPKKITTELYGIIPGMGTLPPSEFHKLWVPQFDWHPALKPYDIP